MKAMILAAGLGTRLRPLTAHCPKPLLPLMLQPMLTHWLRLLYRQGIRDVIINVHHHAARITRWLGDGSQWGLHLTVSYEEEILGTAGALKRVAPLLGEAPFVVVNADVLIDIDLAALWRWHMARRHALVTMVVRPDPAARAFGAVVLDQADRVLHINGRPAEQRALAGLETLFTGVQMVTPSILDRIPPERFVSTTTEVYPTLVADHQAVHGYRHTGYWIDIGVPERYLRAHWDLLAGKLGETWKATLPPASRIIDQATLRSSQAAGVRIIPPVVLGPAVTLEAEAQIGPFAVLGSGCYVATGARVQESVLGDEVRIGAGADVRHSIMGQAVQVSPGEEVSHAVRAEPTSQPQDSTFSATDL